MERDWLLQQPTCPFPQVYRGMKTQLVPSPSEELQAPLCPHSVSQVLLEMVFTKLGKTGQARMHKDV